mmetsp:Transcript_12588/g.27813  ORF Transcript_12588/g.27813 Transcript_12588/m.27813 type:complete len:139 (+) Transcript_12588:339-755(+)
MTKLSLEKDLVTTMKNIMPKDQARSCSQVLLEKKFIGMDISIINGTDETTPNFLTGLTIEAGVKHYDMKNRFNRERPQRVQSIRDHLLQSKLWEKVCHLADTDLQNEQTPEKEWLDDDDYLRVHLPGYMKRLSLFSKI